MPCQASHYLLVLFINEPKVSFMPQMIAIGNYQPIQPQYGQEPALYRDNVTSTVFAGMPTLTASMRRSGSGRANRQSMKLTIPVLNTITGLYSDKMIVDIGFVLPDVTTETERQALLTTVVASLNDASIVSSITGLTPLTM